VLQTAMNIQSKAPWPVRLACPLCWDVCSKRSVHLVISTILGVIGVYVWQSSSWSQALYGERWQTSWVWWCAAVPLYIFIGIYFARFAGSFLVRTWLEEVSQSSVTHNALVNIMRGVLNDPAMPAMLASVMNEEIVRSSVCNIIAAVLSSPQVQHAAALAAAAVLRHPSTLEASIAAAGDVLRNQQLLLDLEAGLDSNEMSQFVTTKVCALLRNVLVAEAAVDFLQNVLSHPTMSQALKDRAISFVQDPKVFRAGGHGFIESLKIRRMPRCCGSSDSATSPHNYETVDSEEL